MFVIAISNEHELEEKCEIENKMNGNIIVSPKDSGTFAGKNIKINIRGEEKIIKFHNNSNINSIKFLHIGKGIRLCNCNGIIVGTVEIGCKKIDLGDKANIGRIDIDGENILLYSSGYVKLTGTVTINDKEIEFSEGCDANRICFENINDEKEEKICIYKNSDNGEEESFSGIVKINKKEYICKDNSYITVNFKEDKVEEGEVVKGEEENNSSCCCSLKCMFCC